jgi:hypothetical protein
MSLSVGTRAMMWRADDMSRRTKAMIVTMLAAVVTIFISSGGGLVAERNNSLVRFSPKSCK